MHKSFLQIIYKREISNELYQGRQIIQVHLSRLCQDAISELKKWPVGLLQQLGTWPIIVKPVDG